LTSTSDKKPLKINKSKKKGENEDSGDDYESLSARQKIGQVLTPSDINSGFTEQQVEENLLKAEHTMVDLKTELKKKKYS